MFFPIYGKNGLGIAYIGYWKHQQDTNHRTKILLLFFVEIFYLFQCLCLLRLTYKTLRWHVETICLTTVEFLYQENIVSIFTHGTDSVNMNKLFFSYWLYVSSTHNRIEGVAENEHNTQSSLHATWHCLLFFDLVNFMEIHWKPKIWAIPDAGELLNNSMNSSKGFLWSKETVIANRVTHKNKLLFNFFLPCLFFLSLKSFLFLYHYSS